MPTRPTRLLLLSACLCLPSAALGCASTSTAENESSASDANATSEPTAARGAVSLADPYAVDHDAWKTLGYSWGWTSRPPIINGEFIEFADAYDDVIVVQDSGSMVSVINRDTGRVRWNKQVRRTNTRFTGNTRRENSIVVANETELFEFDLQTGNTIDRTSLNTIATTRPTLFENLAIFGTASGRVIAMDTVNNVRAWEYQLDGLIETAPLKIDDFTVAAVSTQGELRILDIETARTMASGRISGDSASDMVTDGFYVYIGSADQSLYAYDALDGARIWRKRSSRPVTVQPVLIDGVLYATTADSGLEAIEGETGEILWTNPDLAGWVVTTADGDLMVWTGSELVRVDAERGDVIARAALSGVSGLRSNSPFDGDIFLISSEGAVAKFTQR